MNDEKIDILVPRSQVARECGVSTRTIVRWQEARLPGLDAPVFINKHWYFKRSDVERAKAGCAKSAA
jgi:hypothetical protein